MTNNGALQKFSNYNDLNGKPLEVDLTELEITKEDNLFDAVDIHIQENLEDELVKEALAQGLDLRVYAREIEEALENVQKDSVLDYARESSKIASLHFQIKNCEQLLEDAEQLLGQFQSNLGEISFKIQTLQTQSLSLNTKLVNRRGVYDQIYSFISNSLVPPDMINCICESEVNETYMQYLLKLDERIEFFQNKSEKDYLCKCDAQPSLDSLRMKAVEKVREFLLQRIYGLRKPNTNVQMYQQSFLLPNKYFFKFLKQHGRTSSQEVCLIYIETMQKIFLSFFRHYFQSLIKLNLETPEKDYLIGHFEYSKIPFSATRPSQIEPNFFLIGERLKCLDELEKPVIIPHVAEKANQKYYFEELLRSLDYILVDNASAEFLFVLEFFNSKNSSALNIFNSIFSKTIDFLAEKLDSYFKDSFDVFGALLCIRVLQKFLRVLQIRKIPALEKQQLRLEFLIWPRAKELLNMNVDSIKTFDTHKMKPNSTEPQIITERFANFIASLAAINEGWNDQQIDQLLMRMSSEFEQCLKRMYRVVRKKKEKFTFIINNCNTIITAFEKQNWMQNPSRELERFSLILNRTIQKYVDEVLRPFFGPMITFVIETEPLLSRKEEIELDKEMIEHIIEGFSSVWKDALEFIKDDVIKSFTRPKTGTEILHSALTALLYYYQRFLDIMNKKPFNEISLKNELINRHHVMMEVKKHRIEKHGESENVA